MSALHHLATLYATFFYVGKSPKAPGTCGSLAALPLAWWLWSLSWPTAWILFGVLFALGIAAASLVVKRTGKEDNQMIVIDEVLGILLTTSVANRTFAAYAAAFVLFRLFDITKPWPVSWVDKNWKGGAGAIMDDIVAAAIATFLLALFQILLLRFEFTL